MRCLPTGGAYALSMSAYSIFSPYPYENPDRKLSRLFTVGHCSSGLLFFHEPPHSIAVTHKVLWAFDPFGSVLMAPNGHSEVPEICCPIGIEDCFNNSPRSKIMRCQALRPDAQFVGACVLRRRTHYNRVEIIHFVLRQRIYRAIATRSELGEHAMSVWTPLRRSLFQHLGHANLPSGAARPPARNHIQR